MEDRNRCVRKTLLQAAFSLMHAMAGIAGLLTKLPACREFPETTAGISFALNRYFMPYELNSEKLLLAERLEEILDEVRTLRKEAEEQPANERNLDAEGACNLAAVEKILGEPSKFFATSSNLRRHTENEVCEVFLYRNPTRSLLTRAAACPP